MLRTKDVLQKPGPDLLSHALGLVDRLLQVTCDLGSHGLEVDVVVLRDIGDGRGGGDVGAVGSGRVDGGLHDLLDQSKARTLSSGQKYRLVGLGSGSLGCRRRGSR